LLLHNSLLLLLKRTWYPNQNSDLTYLFYPSRPFQWLFFFSNLSFELKIMVEKQWRDIHEHTQHSSNDQKPSNRLLIRYSSSICLNGFTTDLSHISSSYLPWTYHQPLASFSFTDSQTHNLVTLFHKYVRKVSTLNHFYTSSQTLGLIIL
jgi:hypothetical protein